jgi:hypothetical protein
VKRFIVILAAVIGAAAPLIGADFSHIERSLTWSKPSVVTNDFGKVKSLRTAPATEEFWKAWRADKTAMRAAGYSARPSTNGWQALHWKEVTK